MGAFDTQKKEIKRDLKRQLSGLAKAKKIAEALFHQLEGVEGRLTATEEVVDHIHGNEIDSALRLIRDRKDSPQLHAQLEQLAQRMTLISVHQGLARSMKIKSAGRRLTRRTTAGRKPVSAKAVSKVSSKVASKVSSKVASKVSSRATSKVASKRNKASTKSEDGRSVKPDHASVLNEGGSASVKEEEDGSNDGVEDMEEEDED